MPTLFHVCYRQRKALVEFGVYTGRDEAFRVCAGIRGQGYDAGVYESAGGQLEQVDLAPAALNADARPEPSPAPAALDSAESEP